MGLLILLGAAGLSCASIRSTTIDIDIAGEVRLESMADPTFVHVRSALLPGQRHPQQISPYAPLLAEMGGARVRVEVSTTIVSFTIYRGQALRQTLLMIDLIDQARSLIGSSQMQGTVDSAGQISLGRQFAGRSFSIQVRDHGVVVLEPVARVGGDAPVREDAVPATLNHGDQRWVEENRARIEAYNAWAERRPTFSASVREWRRVQADDPRTPSDAG
jgi:hypothetical protein